MERPPCSSWARPWAPSPSWRSYGCGGLRPRPGGAGPGSRMAPAMLVLGAAVGAVAVLAIVRLWRFAPSPSGAETELTYGRSSVVGAFLFLLVVVMLPKFAGVSPPNAYRGVMTSDLRNLATAEEAFFADSLRYGSV